MDMTESTGFVQEACGCAYNKFYEKWTLCAAHRHRERMAMYRGIFWGFIGGVIIGIGFWIILGFMLI